MPLIKSMQERKQVEKARRRFSRSRRIYDLTTGQKADLLDLLAQLKPPRVVSDELRKRHGTTIAPHAISDWSRNHHEEILERRRELMSKLDDLPLRFPRERILEAGELYRRLKRKPGSESVALQCLRLLREETGDAAKDAGHALKEAGGPITLGVNVSPKRDWSEDKVVQLVKSLPEGEKKKKIIEGMDLLLEVARQHEHENDPNGRDDRAAGEMPLESHLPRQSE